jgi:hypothetical protein
LISAKYPSAEDDPQFEAVGDIEQLDANVIPFGQSADVDVEGVVEPHEFKAAFVNAPALPSAPKFFEAWKALTADSVPRPKAPSVESPAALQALRAFCNSTTAAPDDPRFNVVDPRSYALAENATAKASANVATAKNFFCIIKINFNYPFW